MKRCSGPGLILFGAAMPAVLLAQTGPWQYLGEANVDGGADHDRIKVARSQGGFRSIKFSVQRAPIDFDRVEVHFEDGSIQRVALLNRISPGAQTRQIGLPGSARAIDNVEFWYQKGFSNSQRPKIRLFGHR